jgi:transcriptional regulator with AAA-type ATPase domain/polyferredoxin
LGSQQASAPVLSDRVVAFLRSLSRERTFSAGTTIIERGEPGRAFYVVSSGEVEIRLVAGAGQYLSLARLGPGSSFGEMALLRREPVSATVEALTEATLLECPEPQFRRALAESEDFRIELMARLAHNLHDTSAEVWSAFQRAEALQMLMRPQRPAGPLVAESAQMARVRARIEALATDSSPVLIAGEAGVGKLYAARKLHEQAAPADAPLIVVDCPRLGGPEAAGFLFGAAAAEGGSGAGIGVLHLAQGGTLILRHVDRLDADTQQRLCRVLEGPASPDSAPALPRTRVIATTRVNPKSLAADGGFTPCLAELFRNRVLEMPRLNDRKTDVLPLARAFLEGEDAGARLRLTTDAEHALVSHRYRHRNVSELRDAVELAALFAEDGEVRQEHIFAGPKDKGVPSEYDLGKLGLLKWLTEGRGLARLRLVVLAAFVGIAAVSLVAAESTAGSVANALIWGVWEPALIFLFLFLGHLWCTVCPLSTAGRWAQAVFCADRPPAAWLKQHGVWLAILGFFLIIWTERVFHMTSHPWPSGVLLAALLAAAIAFAMVFRREAWCRYVCPLGALASSYSLPSAVHVRANPGVCATHCTTHECYKGAGGEQGCPVYHHPLYASESHHCKLCLDCLRTCTHGSARVYLRPPLQAVWVLGGLSETLTPFVLAISLFAIVMLGWTPLTALVGTWGSTAIGLAAMGAGVALSLRLPRMISPDGPGDPVLASKLAFGLLVLAWGPLMAYQLGNVPGLGSILVRPAPGSTSAALWAGQTTVLVVLQVLVVLLAAVLSLVCFWRIKASEVRQGRTVSPRVWRWLLGLSGLYTAVALGITATGVARP